ncbi:FAD/NAD(P)-binding protein, partial [Brevibacterium antiquum]
AISTDFTGSVCTIAPHTLGTSHAFTAPFPALTNTPVYNNSLTHRDPGEFHQFLTSRGWPYSLNDFTPRFLMASYVKEAAQRTTSHLFGRHRHLIGHPTGIFKDSSSRWRVTGSHGEIVADAVVLAGGLGGPQRSIPLGFRSRFIGAVLGSGQQLNACAQKSNRDTPVLVLGTKLSAVELALAILDRGGSVCLASPSGVLPAVRTVLGPSVANHTINTADLRTTIDESLRWSHTSLAELEARPASDPLGLLEYEISEAKVGANSWQHRIGTIIDAINATEFTDPAHLKSQMATVRTFNSRFISAMPLESAVKLQHAAEEGRFSVKQLSDTEEDSTPFSSVLTAQGFDPPFTPQWVTEEYLTLDNGGAIPAELTSSLEFRSPDGSPTNIWALGTRSGTVVPIVNYLRTAVLQVPNLVKSISQPAEQSLVGEPK